MLLALAWGLGFWQQVNRLRDQFEQEPPVALHCRVLSDPQLGGLSASSIVEARLPDGQRCRIRLFWPSGQAVPAYGMEVDVVGSFKPLQGYQQFLFRQGLVGSYAVSSLAEVRFPADGLGLIARFREANRGLLLSEGASGELLAGILLGDSSQLNQSWTGEAFKVSGLTHLIAVSGSHLAVVASLAAWALRKMKVGTRLEVALLCAFVVMYVVLTAFQPSAVRSAGMLAVLQGSRLVGRRSHGPSALCLTACLMLLARPATAFSLGFWLSVFAVFGLTVFLPLIQAWAKSAGQALVEQVAAVRTALGSRGVGVAVPDPFAKPTGADSRHLAKRLGRTLQGGVVEPACASLCAQAATLPLTAPTFANISLIALPANLLATPLVTLILTLGLPVLAFGWLLPPLRALALRLLLVLASLACWLAESLARLPFASALIDADLAVCVALAITAAALLYHLWPLPTEQGWRRLGRAAGAALLALSLLLAVPRPPEMVMLDVGQGDAILLRDGRCSVLVDTGPNATALRQALARNQVWGLDALVISHLDGDHCDAISALSGSVQPNTVYFADGLLQAQPEALPIASARVLAGEGSLSGMKAGDVLVISGRLRLTVLLPLAPVNTGDNPESLVLSLDYDADGDGRPELRVLLTGDAEADVLQVICWRYPDLRFDVLKVAHHGSRKALSSSLLDQWQCQAALLSVGADNHYGHPTPETLGLLQEADVMVFRTDELGDISLRFSPTGVSISYSGMHPFWSQ